MNYIPEGFQIPTISQNVLAAGAGIAEVYTGMIKGQPFRFYTTEIHNAKKSALAKYEVKDTVDMVEFYVDTKNNYTHRIDAHIFTQHPEILPDYSKWKDGKKSDVTEVQAWEAITFSEMGMLIAAGFKTVEQIEAADRDTLMRIGTHWEETLNKAKQHMETKRRAKSKDKAEEEAEELRASLAASQSQINSLTELLAEFKKNMAVSATKKKAKTSTAKRKPGVQKPDSTPLEAA